MTDGGRRGDSKYRSAARHRAACACESARGPNADPHVKLLIQFAVEGSHSALIHSAAPGNRYEGRREAFGRLCSHRSPDGRLLS